MNRPYFMRICGRDFNLEHIVSIEVCESAALGHAICVVEYKDQSITYPIIGTVEENREKLDYAWRIYSVYNDKLMVDTYIERR